MIEPDFITKLRQYGEVYETCIESDIVDHEDDKKLAGDVLRIDEMQMTMVHKLDDMIVSIESQAGIKYYVYLNGWCHHITTDKELVIKACGSIIKKNPEVQIFGTCETMVNLLLKKFGPLIIRSIMHNNRPELIVH